MWGACVEAGVGVGGINADVGVLLFDYAAD